VVCSSLASDGGGGVGVCQVVLEVQAHRQYAGAHDMQQRSDMLTSTASGETFV
jgi:hypothetical protein